MPAMHKTSQLPELIFTKTGVKQMAIPLGLYRHYKGNQYEVIGFAIHSESLEDMVIYRAMYGERGTWVRPLSMWDNLIEVDGKTVKRFEYIGDGSESAAVLIDKGLRPVEPAARIHDHPYSEAPELPF